MKTLTEVVERKGREVVSIGPDATVYETIESMVGKCIGALLVVDDGQLCGTLAETPTSSRGPVPHSYPVVR